MYDKNQIHITGRVIEVSSFKDKKGEEALNLNVESSNKYSDVIHCTVFGSLVPSVLEKIRSGDRVIVIGRLMSYLKKESNVSSFRVIVEKIGLEIEGDVRGSE